MSVVKLKAKQDEERAQQFGHERGGDDLFS
jgi:hypothetical protein